MTDGFRTTSSPAANSRSPSTIAVDNLLRKALRVTDPRDPGQIADALLARYPEEAARERREQAGLPYSTLPDFVPVAGTGTGAAGLELAQARDDLERDLQSLIGSSQLKDIGIELTGWGRTVRQIAANGLAAARLGLDAINFDRALAARRGLGEYARLARYVGTLSDGCAAYFRRFAQSCDVLAGLILVAIGEALAASGVTRSTAIVRVSAADLQMRRNAVINALRSLTGSFESRDQEQYPRGLEAYRSLVERLEDDAQADLSALLEENALAQVMDDLVDLSTGSSIAALRELTTASAFLVQRFQRLIDYGRSAGVGDDTDIGAAKSPPLATFMSALRLFVDAFTATGSNRLLFIARPPITAYGLYGAGGLDTGAERLVKLTTLRGTVIEEIDCFGGCGCDEDKLRCQILLDYILFAIDRAIDLYAVGTDPDARGEPETRAAVTGLVIDRVLVPILAGESCEASERLIDTLAEVKDLLLLAFPQQTVPRQAVDRELRIAYQAEGQIERLVRSLSPSCQAGLFDNDDWFPDYPDESPLRALFHAIVDAEDMGFDDTDSMPATAAFSLHRIAGKVASDDCPPPLYARPATETGPAAGGYSATDGPSAAQQAPAQADQSAAGPQTPDPAALIYGTAITPKGKVDPSTPLGLVLANAGYDHITAMTGPGPVPIKRAEFVKRVRAQLDQSESEFALTIGDAALVRFYDMIPQFLAASGKKGS